MIKLCFEKSSRQFEFFDYNENIWIFELGNT